MRRAIRESVRLFSEVFEPTGPVIELGSLYMPDAEAVSNLRPLFPGLEYIGCDIRRGPGVDRIEDAHRLSFPDESAGTVLLLELLEHLPDPVRAVAEARRIMRDDGLLVVSVPFDLALHAFPADYWRFTPSGLSLLLADFPDMVVFALGPRIKPSCVIAVAAKTASERFGERKSPFTGEVERSFGRSRRRGRASVFKRRGREFFGFLLGRAELSVEFFERPARIEYPGLVPASPPPDDARRS